MSAHNPRMNGPCKATVEELCESTLKHYDDISAKACNWHNSIPKAIRFWYLDRPRIECELSAAKAQIAMLEAKRKEDVQKCESLCAKLATAEIGSKDWNKFDEVTAGELRRRIRTTFPEDFK